MSYATMYTLFVDEPLRGRIMMALLKASKYVKIEDVTVPNHVKRVRLADYILKFPDQVADLFIPQLVADPSAWEVPNPGAVSDGALDAVIAATYDEVALNL